MLVMSNTLGQDNVLQEETVSLACCRSAFLGKLSSNCHKEAETSNKSDQSRRSIMGFTPVRGLKYFSL